MVFADCKIVLIGFIVSYNKSSHFLITRRFKIYQCFGFPAHFGYSFTYNFLISRSWGFSSSYCNKTMFAECFIIKEVSSQKLKISFYFRVIEIFFPYTATVFLALKIVFYIFIQMRPIIISPVYRCKGCFSPQWTTGCIFFRATRKKCH